jgi:hypothetical protein
MMYAKKPAKPSKKGGSKLKGGGKPKGGGSKKTPSKPKPKKPSGGSMFPDYNSIKVA